MKIITNPQVKLVGSSGFYQHNFIEFLNDGEFDTNWIQQRQFEEQVDDTELIPETAGRVCYLSYGKGRNTNHQYIENILKSKHGSVLEHSYFNFIIWGISRSLSHELVRHRVGIAISQLSQRYVDESVANFVEPNIIAEDPEAHGLWLESVEKSHESYNRLVEILSAKLSDVEDKTLRRKMARQSARSVLPNATETMIFWSANARAIRHFIELRGNEHAEDEIRRLALKILDIVQMQAPNLFGDYRLVDKGGIMVAETDYPNV